ncbi:hypothetical protein CVM50_17790 [Pseudooceanicola marinus]|nr:hypothetical protein CVM50_17790 [Pseudooceanicola marinus]
MRQSPSLIKALKAAEEVLSSDSRDLEELAAQASATSGIPADMILMNIDLTGIDLSGQNIDYLTNKGARFYDARITAEQRAKFEKGSRALRTRRMRKNIRSIRVEMISNFVENFEAQSAQVVDMKGERILDADLLKHTLLSPLERNYPSDKPLDQNYTQHVLIDLIHFAGEPSLGFFVELFRLLGDLHCEIGESTAALLMDDYFAEFGDAVGDLIGQLQPNPVLDAQWVYGDPLELVLAKKEEQKNEHFADPVFSSIVGRAKQINSYRPIHPKAIEKVLDHLDSPSHKIAFVETVDFNCSSDEAERIALRIVRADWPASQTRQVLEARVPTKVRSALFRQVMHQGRVERTLEMLRWLNDNRGAVGALSLDEALTRINSFTALFDFASDVHMDLSSNQIGVLREALDRTAKGSAQRAKVRQLLSD